MTVTSLIKELEQIPEDWQLTPVGAKKQPLGYNWQNNPFNRHKLIEAFKRGYCLVYNKYFKLVPALIYGYGLLTGTVAVIGGKTCYLIAVDQDGESAREKVSNLSQGENLPRTVAFTSNRPGRCQYLLGVPEEKAPLISSKRISCAPGEFLELRWKGMQSVLPPSPHPITGNYCWVKNCSCLDVEVAIAPDWVVRTASSLPKQESTISHHSDYLKHKKSLLRIATDIEKQKAIALLFQIPARVADDYHSWIRVGMALKSVSLDLLPFWDRWSQQSEKWKPGECEFKWYSFGEIHSITIGTLYWLARNS